MLGKLIKYDLKYNAKIFFLLHALLLIFCIFARVMLLDRMNFANDADMIVAQLTIFISLFILLFSGVCMGVMFLLAIRFYKNLFSDEGYLTWTIPASPTQQLWAKIISGTILYIVHVIIFSLSIMLLFSGDNVVSAYKLVENEITSVLGMPMSQYAMLMLAYLLVCSIFTVIFIYVCIAIGQLFAGHRILCSIIVYFIFTTLLQVAILFVMFITKTFPTARDIQSQMSYLIDVFALSGGLWLVISIIHYIILHYIMNKKINLL